MRLCESRQLNQASLKEKNSTLTILPYGVSNESYKRFYLTPTPGADAGAQAANPGGTAMIS